MISGVNLGAYWLSTYIFDIFKSLFVAAISISFIYIYGLKIDPAWILFLLYPFAIVPYTYVISIVFKDESKA